MSMGKPSPGHGRAGTGTRLSGTIINEVLTESITK
jgi:hypothetical protein